MVVAVERRAVIGAVGVDGDAATRAFLIDVAPDRRAALPGRRIYLVEEPAWLQDRHPARHLPLGPERLVARIALDSDYIVLDDILPVAEETGLVADVAVELDRRVVEIVPAVVSPGAVGVEAR